MLRDENALSQTLGCKAKWQEKDDGFDGCRLGVRYSGVGGWVSYWDGLKKGGIHFKGDTVPDDFEIMERNGYG